MQGRELISGKPIEKLNPPDNIEPAALTEQQQVKYDAILAKYQNQMRDVFRQARGNRQEIGKNMQKLMQQQHQEMRELLNETQFTEYMKEQSEKRNQRRQRR